LTLSAAAHGNDLLTIAGGHVAAQRGGPTGLIVR
jgi:hypothetical protein